LTKNCNQQQHEPPVQFPLYAMHDDAVRARDLSDPGVESTAERGLSSGPEKSEDEICNMPNEDSETEQSDPKGSEGDEWPNPSEIQPDILLDPLERVPPEIQTVAREDQGDKPEEPIKAGEVESSVSNEPKPEYPSEIQSDILLDPLEQVPSEIQTVASEEQGDKPEEPTKAREAHSSVANEPKPEYPSEIQSNVLFDSLERVPSKIQTVASEEQGDKPEEHTKAREVDSSVGKELQLEVTNSLEEQETSNADEKSKFEGEDRTMCELETDQRVQIEAREEMAGLEAEENGAIFEPLLQTEAIEQEIGEHAMELEINCKTKPRQSKHNFEESNDQPLCLDGEISPKESQTKTNENGIESDTQKKEIGQHERAYQGEKGWCAGDEQIEEQETAMGEKDVKEAEKVQLRDEKTTSGSDRGSLTHTTEKRNSFSHTEHDKIEEAVVIDARTKMTHDTCGAYSTSTSTETWVILLGVLRRTSKSKQIKPNEA